MRHRDAAGRFVRQARRGLDITGKKFGRLTVIRAAGFYTPSAKNRFHQTERLWLCRCSCGSDERVTTKTTYLRKNKIRSCGCLILDHLKIVHAENTHHGHARRNGKKSATYSVWEAMMRRCLPPEKVNPDKVPYGWNAYGGAKPPVKVARRWYRFENFLADMGPKPEGKSLSRFSDMGDYKPGNVTWHTRSEQAIEAAKKRKFKARNHAI